MVFNPNKSFEVQDGIILNLEGGAGLFTGTDDPTGTDAPVGSRFYRTNGGGPEIWTKFDVGVNDWRREGKGKSLSTSFTNGNSDPFLTKTGATYSTAAQMIWPGSDIFGNISSASALLAVKAEGKAAALRIYDSTNAQVIFELLNFSNEVFASLDLGILVNTPSTDSADWEIQIKRVDTGAEGRLGAILILN